MSATNRGATRVPSDNYPTPIWAIRALFRRIGQDRWRAPKLSRLFEPFAGDGRVFRVAEDYVGSLLTDDAQMLGFELRTDVSPFKSRANVILGFDSVELLADAGVPMGDLCVTNPPYSKALESIEAVVPRVDGVSWFLLRVGFFESEGRSEWLLTNKPAFEYKLWKRPDFVAMCKGTTETKGGRARQKSCGASYDRGTTGACECGGSISAGTDAAAYAWYGWESLGSDTPFVGDMLDLDGLDFTEL